MSVGVVLISTGSGAFGSRKPILFSTHSVNHTLSSFVVKSSTWATPQSCKAPQSDQFGFFEGTRYSTREFSAGSKTPILFATCSLNQILPLLSIWFQYGLEIGVLINPDAFPYVDSFGIGVKNFVNCCVCGSKLTKRLLAVSVIHTLPSLSIDIPFGAKTPDGRGN